MDKIDTLKKSLEIFDKLDLMTVIKKSGFAEKLNQELDLMTVIKKSGFAEKKSSIIN